MTTIYFSKTFLSGHLTGLTVHGHLAYPTVETCAKMVHVGKTGKDYGTKARWIITDASFQNYARETV